MTIAGDFRRRALFEARRYGGDAWVFVRELLQNSRDAGATRVDLTVERRDGLDRIVCRDNGCGMRFDHARRYLFTLYASSKTKERNSAGRFGIGFWSVLRFQPEEVVVRSAPVGETGWQVRLKGELDEIGFRELALDAGTEIELVRRVRGDHPETEVWRAVRRDARYLRCRDRDGRILEVYVNSRLATTEIELNPPSLAFVRRGLRGAVALADRPRVDLLAHGLRVRTTATLDELLTQPDRRRRRRSSIPDGLAPRLILDSRRLRILMARGDARTDRELRQLVAAGRRGVRRLVRGQLDQEAGLGRFGRAAMRFRELVTAGRARRLGAGVVVAALLIVGVWWLAGLRSGRSDGTGAGGSAPADHVLLPPGSILWVDAADRYRGPAVDVFQSRPSRVSLGYRPSTAEPLLGVFRVTSMDDAGRVVSPATSPRLRPYLGSACRISCIEIVLDLDGVAGNIRLPVPTGHVLDPASVELAGGSATLWAAADGGPVLEAEGALRGRVHYRTGPGAVRQPVVRGSWPKLPAAADDLASSLRNLPADDAARRARDWVRRHVVYDNSERTVERHRRAIRDGLSFAERCLAVGGGDCDVQNALLAAVLARASIPVRLSVGFVGAGGRALPGLHAWVEYRNEGGFWRPIDASRGSPFGAPGSGNEEGRRAWSGESPGSGVAATADTSPLRRSRVDVPGRRTVMIAIVFGLVAVAAIRIARRRVSIHHIRSTDTPNLVGLLRGALARPDAYAEVPALFSRRVVPVVAAPSGAGAVSLDRARDLARRGRLAVSAASTDLARRVVATGLPVIDGSRPEGEVVAATLGAVDLDRWDATMTRGGGHPMARRLERAAAGVGETWTVVVCPDLGEEIDVLCGPLTGLGRRHSVVAVDDGGGAWRTIVRLETETPAAALLLLAESVVDLVRMPPETRRRLLSGLAAAVVSERAGGRS